jgi:NitT/TauT family transport system substrate-binding protein
MNVPSALRSAFVSAALVASCCLALLVTGCSSSSTTPTGLTKLTVAHLGLTCEAPIFAAQQQGFYKEEGLEVTLVKTDWDGLREGLGTGKYDANHTLIMYLLKAIEQEVDIKITGGIHTGCLRLQVAADSKIKTIADLKGKKIGVPTHIGSPPFLFSCRVLVANGIDPRPDGGDVQWRPYPPGELGQAVQQGKVDACCTADPIGTILLGKGIVRTIADQAVDEPYKDEYCCAVAVSGKLARTNPAAAAKVTRAMLKAARWVEENPTAAAKYGVEKKYIAASAEVNAQALLGLKYQPGVSRCRESVERAAKEMKKAGLLKESTDSEALAKRTWLDLEGVNDEWIKGLKVAKVAGDRPERLSPAGFVALFEAKKDCTCCCRCCADFAP